VQLFYVCYELDKIMDKNLLLCLKFDVEYAECFM
jgi:hypothetical protein